MTSTIKSHILSTLEGGGFQDLCDTLLCAEGYEGIFSLGMKAGSLKTTIGNPDTYFRSKSGKYIFVAYTTEQTNINKKIKEDVEKCLDQEKTGVDVKDIEKMNLTVKEMQTVIIAAAAQINEISYEEMEKRFQDIK